METQGAYIADVGFAEDDKEDVAVGCGSVFNVLEEMTSFASLEPMSTSFVTLWNWKTESIQIRPTILSNQQVIYTIS